MISQLLENPIVQNCIVAFFGLLQTLLMVLLGAGFKTYFDTKQNKRDLNQAFLKIRNLETTVYGIPAQSSLGPSAICDQESSDDK